MHYRTPSESGLSAEYMWDLRSLCAAAGNEYQTAARDGGELIRFNVCGTVAAAIAPVDETPNPDFPNGVQYLPLPYSHGVAVQVRF